MTSADDFYVHPSSVVDEGASIGKGTKVWHFCHIFAGAVLGEGCSVGQGCSIAGSVQIGNGVKLQNGISVYDGVILEDDVFCGPHMVFSNVINPRAFIERKEEYRSTRVGKGASIGAGAVIVCGNAIGAYAFVGAGSVVTREVLPYALVYGNPARQHGWVGRSGNKLEFDDAGQATDSDGTQYSLQEGRATPASA